MWAICFVWEVLKWERGLIKKKKKKKKKRKKKKKKKLDHTENFTILETGGGWPEAHESSAPVGFHMADTPAR